MGARYGHRLDPLTAREQDVARLMARGFTNGQIADELGITFATAKWHVSQVISKLGASSREEAAATWHAEQRVSTRLTRALAGLVPGAALRTAAIVALGALVAAGIGGLLLVLLNSDDEATPANGGATPTIDASATPALSPTTAAALSPCDPANLINGFLVLAEDAPVPDCVGPGMMMTPDEAVYELAVPPGPYDQRGLDDGEFLGWAYFVPDPAGDFRPVFRVYRDARQTTEPPIARGSSPEAADFLPGPGVLVRRGEMTELWWVEDQGAYLVRFAVEMSPSASGLSPEQAASLLVYFDPLREKATYWDPGSHTFRAENRAPWMYPDGTQTGLTSVDTVLAAALQGTGALPFAPVSAPCVAEPTPDSNPPPQCPDGAPAGTLVPALLRGTCTQEWVALPPGGPFFAVSGDRPFGWLHAIARPGPDDPLGVSYLAAFTTGERAFVIPITDEGLAGIGSGCTTPQLVDWAHTYSDWLLPPLYPLPVP